MPRETPPEVDDWIERLAPALDLDPQDVATNRLLGLTGQVAHGVTRPAGPVTTYLLGLAVASGRDLEDAAGVVTTQLAAWKDEHPAEGDETDGIRPGPEGSRS
ncbi:DUF6457 domain-containing protein [Brachybacterium endophyticum]|uniref:DUF6457 domain-containing protein n=1 Tax=Brachybacterium endophyticum TaxID=2182385 RepID=UPI00196AF9B4|nr:DUF6457 domain-containing protein [Brachybacterium endophyticum]